MTDGADVHRVVALALPGVVAFDLSIAAQIFGHRSAQSLYSFAVCAPKAGLVTSSTGFQVPQIPFVPNKQVYVITCVDPRVDPADIFGLTLGDGATARNPSPPAARRLGQCKHATGFANPRAAPQPCSTAKKASARSTSWDSSTPTGPPRRRRHLQTVLIRGEIIRKQDGGLIAEIDALFPDDIP